MWHLNSSVTTPKSTEADGGFRLGEALILVVGGNASRDALEILG